MNKIDKFVNRLIFSRSRYKYYLGISIVMFVAVIVGFIGLLITFRILAWIFPS